MRPQAQKKGHFRHYRWRAKELAYACEQGGVAVEKIDNQVINILMHLKPPEDWRTGITKAMSEILGERNIEERSQEIKDVIKRMDTRWDHGFFANEDEYVQQRIRLQMELEQLSPIPTNELEQAADLLANFRRHWDRLEGNPEAQHDLVKLIVDPCLRAG